MVRDDAVPGGEDTLEVGAHAPVHADGSADAEGGPGFGRQGGVGPHADDDEHQVGKAVNSAPDDSTASIWKRPAEPSGARAMRLTVVLVLTSTPCVPKVRH